MAKRQRKVRIFIGRDGRFYFDPIAGNGEVTASSESYTRRASAQRAVRAMFGENVKIENDYTKPKGKATKVKVHDMRTKAGRRMTGKVVLDDVKPKAKPAKKATKRATKKAA